MFIFCKYAVVPDLAGCEGGFLNKVGGEGEVLLLKCMSTFLDLGDGGNSFISPTKPAVLDR